MADVETKPAAELARRASLTLVDPQALISKAIETGADIVTMERLVALAKDVREVQAREAWYDAMAEFQRTCPTIKKTSTAKMKGYSYRFAPLDEICATIQPIMGPLGLSMRWTTPKIEADKVSVACLITHRLGHVESSGDVVMPVMGAVQRTEGGEGGANAAQRVGISLTYAKRYSLLGIIGMAPEDDDDAQEPKKEAQGNGEAPQPGTAGVPITEPQVKRFWAIARGTTPPWTEEQVHELLTSKGIESVKAITVGEYDAAIDRIKQGPGKK